MSIATRDDIYDNVSPYRRYLVELIMLPPKEKDYSICNRYSRYLGDLSILIAFLCTLCFLAALLYVHSKNARLSGIYISDEEYHIYLIRDALWSGSWNLDFHGYGHLFFNVTLLLLYALSHLFNIETLSDQSILIALRAVSFISFLGVLYVTYILIQRIADRFVATLTVLTLATIPLELLTYATISHPDILQLLLLLLALDALSRYLAKPSRAFIFRAGAYAGAAFGAKYSGILLLPLLLMVCFYESYRSAQNQRGTSRISIVRCALGILGVILLSVSLLIDAGNISVLFGSHRALTPLEHNAFTAYRYSFIALSICMLGVTAIQSIWKKVEEKIYLQQTLILFCGTCGIFIFFFTICSPYSWYHLRFIKGIAAESLHVSFGHVFHESYNPLAWITVLSSSNMMGPLLGVGCLLYLYWICRSSRNLALNQRTLALLYIGIFLGYLICRVRYIEPRYLFPVLPVTIALGICGLQITSAFLMRSLKQRALYARILTCTILALYISIHLPIFLTHRALTLSQPPPADTEVLAAWLTQNYPVETRIAYDAYTYVPPQFQAATRRWEWTTQNVAAMHPDLFIANLDMRSLYEQTELRDRYIGGSEKFDLLHEFNQAITSNALSFKNIFVTGRYIVYAYSPSH